MPPRRLGVTALATLLAVSPSMARAEGELTLPEPVMPAPVVVEERGESPVYYRNKDDRWGGSGRLTLGAATRLPVGGATAQTAFRLDVLVGAGLALRRQGLLTILGEGGYSFVGFSENYITAGLGPFLRSKDEVWVNKRDTRSFWDKAWLGLVPRGLFGSNDGELAWGVRTVLMVGSENAGLELAHQYVKTPTRAVQEVQVAFVWYPFYPERSK
jgi:hypothetical protein